MKLIKIFVLVTICLHGCSSVDINNEINERVSHLNTSSDLSESAYHLVKLDSLAVIYPEKKDTIDQIIEFYQNEILVFSNRELETHMSLMSSISSVTDLKPNGFDLEFMNKVIENELDSLLAILQDSEIHPGDSYSEVSNKTAYLAKANVKGSVMTKDPFSPYSILDFGDYEASTWGAFVDRACSKYSYEKPMRPQFQSRLDKIEEHVGEFCNEARSRYKEYIDLVSSNVSRHTRLELGGRILLEERKRKITSSAKKIYMEKYIQDLIEQENLYSIDDDNLSRNKILPKAHNLDLVPYMYWEKAIEKQLQDKAIAVDHEGIPFEGFYLTMNNIDVNLRAMCSGDFIVVGTPLEIEVKERFTRKSQNVRILCIDKFFISTQTGEVVGHELRVVNEYDFETVMSDYTKS